MIKYSSYTNHLQFSLPCHHNKILPTDLQLKSRIKTEQSKAILQERAHVNLAIRYRLHRGIEQLKGKILVSVTSKEFHLVEEFHRNSYKKYAYLTIKRHIRKCEELISKNTLTQSATKITAY